MKVNITRFEDEMKSLKIEIGVIAEKLDDRDLTQTERDRLNLEKVQTQRKINLRWDE